MGYNRREYLEPAGAPIGSYRFGSSSNGPGTSIGTEGLAASMAMLSVTSSSGQSTPGGSLSNLSGAGETIGSSKEALLSAPQKTTSLVSTTSGSIFSLGRTSLNPNAAEFVPKTFKPGSPAVSGNLWDTSKPAATVTTDKDVATPILDRTNSTNSNASDDEYRRFCRSQLPDDLMSDFDFGEFAEVADYGEPSLDVSSRVGIASGWAGGGVTGTAQGDGFNYDERAQQSALRAASYSPPRGSSSRYTGGQLREEGATSSGTSFAGAYMPELRAPAQRLSSGRDRQPPWADNSESPASFNDWGPEQTFPEELVDVDPVNLLAAEFPGFASESLAEIYYANGGDLGLTMEMLTELELQAEGGPSKQFQAPQAPSPSSPRDFPSLSGLEAVNGSALSSRASTLGGESRSVPDFAAVVRKQAAQQAAQLQYERNGGVELSLGGVRGLSQVPGVGGFPRDARVAHGERLEPYHLHGHDVHQPPPSWLETGDTVGSMYTDMREEARDHARVRNAYFDQARQAYLVGNKVLAKELSAKGQWHNEQMKAAHSKAGEAIFWQRNSNAHAQTSTNPGQSRLLDLHTLHVSDAIPALKREIAALRFNVRNTRQREQVFIFVGTGHHTKGSRTSARLPAAVQRYLAEEEHLQFAETQPGMLRIIIR